MPGYTFPTILMSIIGGYSVGAYCVNELYKEKKIDSKQVNRLMSFCVNAGPGFIITTLGNTILKNQKIGVWLFLIQVFSSLIIALISAVNERINKNNIYSGKETNSNYNFSISELFIDSCQYACESIIIICAVIVAFFAITSIINNFWAIEFLINNLLPNQLIINYLKVFFAGFLEITQGCLKSAELKAPLWLISWIIGFGGICGHMQVISALSKTKFSHKKFFCYRVLNGIISVLLSLIIFKNEEICIQTYTAFKVSHKPQPGIFPTSSLLLLILCIFFTASVRVFKHPVVSNKFCNKKIKKNYSVDNIKN